MSDLQQHRSDDAKNEFLRIEYDGGDRLFVPVHRLSLVQRYVGAEGVPPRMDKLGGLIHSQRVLLALTQAGLERDAAYRLVQRNAMQVWESDGALNLLELLKADPEVASVMSAGELEDKFNLDYHFKAVDTIFARVFAAE